MNASPDFGRVIVFALLIYLLAAFDAPDASALIFASPEVEPTVETPDDFPYWEHVTQRRYDGPTVLYLGDGWVLTARHVGLGEIFLDGELYLPSFGSARTLLNINGTAADMVVFRLARNAELPDLPLLPLASEPPRGGEEVILIGFGRERAKVIEWDDGRRTRFGFEWTKSGHKRWGTNRVTSNHEILVQGQWTTRVLSFLFDPPHSPDATDFESHAAVGDSGGAVFVKREGVWLLVGMMTSVSSPRAMLTSAAQYGDMTYAADISYYRSELFRWTRAHCANEEDDDGDGKIDFPLDPDCEDRRDQNERTGRRFSITSSWLAGLAGLGVLTLSIVGVRRAT